MGAELFALLHYFPAGRAVKLSVIHIFHLLIMRKMNPLYQYVSIINYIISPIPHLFNRINFIKKLVYNEMKKGLGAGGSR